MNILKPTSLNRKVVSVVRLTSPGFYIVTDSSGRKSTVGSSTSWRRGDSVVVLGNHIIGGTGRVITASIAEV